MAKAVQGGGADPKGQEAANAAGVPPNTKPFLVYRIGPNPEPGGASGLPGPVPAKYRMTEIGCFFATDGEDACRMAARSENQLGYFAAVEATSARLDFCPDGPQVLPSVVETKAAVEKQAE
jgi:hypothetical protein